METEIEVKFPEIDPTSLCKRLKGIGAKQIHPEILMKRKTFDYPNHELYKVGGWVRIRDEGDRVTLSYKQLDNRTLHGTKEVTVTVNDFDKTSDFLTAIGLRCKSYQETKREKWQYKDVEITIDTWPWVPTFVELEGLSETSVKEAADKLCLDWNNAMYGSVEPIYQMHYNVTEKEIDSWTSITFVPPPDWLLARKK